MDVQTVIDELAEFDKTDDVVVVVEGVFHNKHYRIDAIKFEDGEVRIAVSGDE
jgi:hypothetical protein